MRFFVSLIIAYVCSCAGVCLSQQINGPTSAVPGSLVILDSGDLTEARPAWILNYPEAFAEYAIENNKVFLAMPKTPVSLTMLVIPNDPTKPIVYRRHTIGVGGTSPPVTPPPVTPPIDPPSVDPTTSPLFQACLKSFAKLSDPSKATNGKKMADAFLKINARIVAGEFSTVDEMMAAVGQANRASIDVTSLKHWEPFRDEVSKTLDALETDGKLKIPSDYVIHWAAIAAALNSSIGNA